MPRVLVEHLGGKRRGERQELAGERVRFGRHPDNEVAFDPFADLDASTWHAELRKEDGGWIVVDLNSSNGTFVDGKSVTRAPVRAGARHKIVFGKGGPECAITVDDAMIPETRERDGRLMGPETVQGLVRDAVADAQSRTSRRLALTVAGLSLAAIAVLGVIIVKQSRRPAPRPPAPPPPDEPGPRIASANEHAIFLLVDTDGANQERALCTAFAIRPDLLATNAHCVDRIHLGGLEKQTFFAAQNSSGDRFKIVGSWTAEGYRGGGRLSTDVGLLEISPPVQDVVVVASRERLKTLASGTRVWLLGFPAVAANPEAPVASLLDGTIGRVTNFGGIADPDSGNNWVVQHNVGTGPGASGSPLFDARGQVVAIDVGQAQELYGDDKTDPATGMKLTLPPNVSPGVNLAIRIDALFSLIEKVKK